MATQQQQADNLDRYLILMEWVANRYHMEFDYATGQHRCPCEDDDARANRISDLAWSRYCASTWEENR